MRIKRIIKLFLVLLLTLGLFTGCTNKSEETDGTVTLASIAKLNDVEEDSLNVVYDDNGYLTFLSSGRFDETKIEDEEEAKTFLTEKMKDLLSLEGINLEYSDKYTSSNTDVTYYRFEQTLNGDFYGLEGIALKYLVNTVKLGVDKDGYPIVLSSDLNHDDLNFDTANLATKEEATEKVKNSYPDSNVYEDYTSLGVWTDSSSKNGNTTKASASLCYMVYTDNPSFESSDTCSPYLANIVNADKTDGLYILANLAVYNLGEYAEATDSMTTAFFEGKEDVGTYTYTVNFDWMSDSNKEHTLESVGTDNMEISVPLMYSESEGLYYLGESEHNISMSNWFDFIYSGGDVNRLNPYVTDNPDDLNSWHFKYSENISKNVEKYFDDPNYVLASFAEYYKTVELFCTKYDMFDQYPSDSYLLLTYSSLDPSAYPSDVSQFVKDNAFNAGTMYNWNIFETSPNGSVCLDDVVLGHEFTHCLNNHFTDTICRNEQGAVMEAVADMVGYQVAASNDASYNTWLIGGRYSSVIRCLYDPSLMGNPKYINGLYYVNPIKNNLVNDIYLDFGGVHFNNCIPGYMGFMLVNGDTGEGEENITLSEGADLWFEAVCLTNYDTDFKNLGAYLKYAGDVLGYSENKKTYIASTIKKYGFEDGITDASLLEGEEGSTLNVVYTFEDGLNSEDYNKGIHFYLSEGAAFETSDELNTDVTVPEDSELVSEYITILDNSTGIKYSAWTSNPIDFGKTLTYNIKKLEIEEGKSYEFPDDEYTINYDTYTQELVPNTLTSEDIGKMYMTSTVTDSNTVNLYLVCAK